MLPESRLTRVHLLQENSFYYFSTLIDLEKNSLVLDGNLADSFRGYGTEFAAIHEVLKHRGKTDEKTMEKIRPHLVKLGIEPAQYMQNPEEFAKGLQRRAKKLAEQVRQVIEPVTIRRNRIDLKTDPQLMGALGAAEYARQKGMARV